MSLEKLKLVRIRAAACTESNRIQFYNSTPNNNLMRDAKWWNQYACHVFLLFGTKPMLDMKKGAGAINSYIVVFWNIQISSNLSTLHLPLLNERMKRDMLNETKSPENSLQQESKLLCYCCFQDV